MLGTVKELIRPFFIFRLKIKASAAMPMQLNGNALILAPHPDDEIFGCGGLIARLTSQGKPPHVAILTGGGRSHHGCCATSEETIVTQRRTLTIKSLTALGIPACNIHFLNFQDGNIGDKPGSEMNRLKNLLSDLQPDTILVPHHGEGWPDHLATRQIGIDLAPKGAQVWEYCVWMWYYSQHGLDWKNARTLNMSATEHASKLNAIATYSNSCAPCGKPWIGVLPKLFIRANSKKHELFFRITK